MVHGALWMVYGSVAALKGDIISAATIAYYLPTVKENKPGGASKIRE